MIEIEVTATGITPLLCNRLRESDMEQIGTRTSSRKAPLTPEQEAESKLYGTTEAPYFPGENIRQAMIAGASRSKSGRKSASYDTAAALFVTPDAVPLQGTWVTDTRAVVNPATRGRNLRSRPRFDQWSLTFHLQIDETLIQPHLVREILDNTGNYVGLGDFRPAKKGPYGRFRVDSWQEVK